MMTDTLLHVDVVIVGAGPTGSMLALLLAQNGVRTLIADREADIYPLPRAAHIDHETLRIFQAVGLADAIAATCRQSPRYDFLTKDGDVLLRFDGADDIGAGGWPIANMIHQPSIERLLRKALVAEALVDLKTGWTFTDHAQDDEHITARFSSRDGERIVKARYIVGADGARSPVRTASGIAVDDLDFNEPWLVIDTIVHDESRLPKINLQICDPERPTTCVLMGSGRHRWEFMLKPGETADQVMEDDFVADLMRPWHVEGAVSIERKTVYWFAARIAAEWQRDRTLIAGDAAHQMPPFAGQGMCSGLRDAHNLAWKLAAVIEHDAPAGRLLATYQAERLPNIRSIVGLAMMMGRTVCTLDPDAAARRDAEMMAARADGTTAPRPPAMPPFPSGCILKGSPAAGSYFPQLASRVPTAGRLDDALGPKAWLIARGGHLPHHQAYHCIALDDARYGAYRSELAAWLDGHGVEAVLVRPDRYVFGTGNAADLATAFLGWITPKDRIPYRRTTSSSKTASCSKEKTMNIDGSYDIIVKSPMGDQTSKLTVKTDGATFAGTNSGALGTNEITGTVSGNTLTWQERITVPMPMTLDATATIDGDAIRGSVKAGAFGAFEMTGTRAA